MKPTRASHWVKVEYDSTTRSLHFSGGSEGKSIASLELKDLKDGEVEQRVGFIVIAGLSSFAGHSIGGRNYREERNDAVPWILDYHKDRVKAGDRSAVLSMVNELIASAIRNSDLAEIERADRLLRDAAEGGNTEAAKYLEERWLRDKQDIVGAIQRKTSE